LVFKCPLGISFHLVAPGRDEEASAKSVRYFFNNVRTESGEANREYGMPTVLAAGKRTGNAVFALHFATNEQSSEAGLMSLAISLAQQGATRHFHPGVLGDLYHTTQGQLNLACLRLQGFLSGWLGGAEIRLGGPQMGAVSLTGSRTRTYDGRESHSST
jgi:hypothetical protein